MAAAGPIGRATETFPGKLSSEYRQDLRNRRLSSNTQHAYHYRVRKFLEWASTVDDSKQPMTAPDLLSTGAIERYVSVIKDNGASARTVNSLLTAISDFRGFLARRGPQ